MSLFSFVRMQFSDSLKSLRHTRTLATAGMMLAVQIVLSFFGTIYVNDSLRISLGHLALAPTAMLFGPVVAGAQAAFSDILSFLLRPSGPYFPGFTISALLSGLVYGMAFYKTRCTTLQIIVARALIVLLLNILLNTVFLVMLYGSSRLVTLPARAVKNIVQFPFDCVLLIAVCRFTRRIRSASPAVHE